MSHKKRPKTYKMLTEKYPGFIRAVEALGKAVRQEGSLDERTAHLIQIAGAAAVGSEGAVHSHVKRAIKAGVDPEQIQQAVILLTSTIGFPQVAAAFSWAQDVINNK